MNIGNPEEYTMIDLAHKVKKMMGATSKLFIRIYH